MQLTWKLLLGLVLAAGLPAAAQPEAPEPTRPVRRDLTIRLDLGGTEPGTSKQAFEGNVSWRGVRDYELQAGVTYSDQVDFSSSRGYATVYRFFAEGMSYVKADATLRKYAYPNQGSAPNPDSNSYEWVPRAELEASHLFTRAWRAGLQYQLFPANFYWDTASWTVNHKLSGQLDFQPIPELTLTGRVAVLRDPDPDRTAIRGRVLPNASSISGCVFDPNNPAPLPVQCFATRTSVAYRTSSLLGGGAAVELGRAGLKLEYIPNRDLDNSYAWSLLGTVDVRVTRRVDVRLQAVHDIYSSVSNFDGRKADIVMAAVGFQVSDTLRLRGGFKYVDVPYAPPDNRRRDGTLLVGLELRPGL